MLFAVIFEDEPSKADVRPKLMPSHKEFLLRRSDAIKAAGPLLGAGGTGAGGLWVVEAADEAAVDALVREDPFWPSGLRKSVRILQWRQVVADGKWLM